MTRTPLMFRIPLLAAFFFLGSCKSDSTGPDAAAIESILLSSSSVALVTGETAQLTATVADVNGTPLTGRTVTWTTNAPSIATVSSVGLVTGVAEGTASITAAAEGKSATASVTVSRAPVATVVLSPATGSVVAGATLQLTASVRDSRGNVLSDRPVAWTSSNSAVASVSAEGLVSGVAQGGPVTISASAEGIVGSATITVLPPPVATVSLTPQTFSVGVGASVQLTATLRDGAGNIVTGRPIIWSTSNAAAATVSTTGLVTGVAAGGVATITAESEGKRGTADVSVTAGSSPIGAGNFHTCWLQSSGTANCWGSNQYGQLGDGTTTDRLSPVVVAGGLTFASLAPGNFHTCGVTTAGAAHCWGRNPNGQLGTGTTTNRSTPTAVSGGLTFKSIVASGDFISTLQVLNAGHTCALTPAGTAYCWGYGNDGALGDGTATSRSTPTAVTGGLAFVHLVAGSRSTCGLTEDGSAYCWGFNGKGELGDGTSTRRNAPVAVSGGQKFRQLAAAGGLGGHTCGLTASGTAYCWGSNFDGELGDGTTTQRLTPVQVSGGLSFSMIAAGGWAFAAHSCGLTTLGTAYCWGDNGDGQLGDGSTTSRLTPQAVAGGLVFTAITARWNHTCASTATGAIYCWGQNDSGQLGDGTRTNRLVPTRVIQP